MTPVDTIALACTLSRWRGDPTRCRWCDDRLEGRRRVWCGSECDWEYRRNHVWYHAKRAARTRDRGCVECRKHPVQRPGLREVHHRQPCAGTRTQSCAHHLGNLQTLCAAHHHARHREIALKSYQS